MSNSTASNLRGEQQAEVIQALGAGVMAFPHLRVGQLIENAVSSYRKQSTSDLFYVSDVELAAAIRSYIQKYERKSI